MKIKPQSDWKFLFPCWFSPSNFWVRLLLSIGRQDQIFMCCTC